MKKLQMSLMTRGVIFKVDELSRDWTDFATDIIETLEVDWTEDFLFYRTGDVLKKKKKTEKKKRRKRGEGERMLKMREEKKKRTEKWVVHDKTVFPHV